MSDLHSNCYRTASTGTLRVEQDSMATEERNSRTGEDNRDDNVTAFDAGCSQKTCRGSSKHKNNKTQKMITKERRKYKERSRREEITLGSWNMQTMQDDGYIDLPNLDTLFEEMRHQKVNILGLSGNFKEGSRRLAVIPDKALSTSLKSYDSINDRIMIVKLDAKPAQNYIIQVYAPTSKTSKEEIETL